MTEGVTSELASAGHAAKEAAKKTVDELLDLFLGILLPIGLFIAGYILAVKIGGFTGLGNFLWGTIGGGSNMANPITGPQNGAITGVVWLGIWAAPAIALLHMSRGAGSWSKWILRSIGAFFGGLAAFAAYFTLYSLNGGVASTLLGSGGIIDGVFGSLQSAADNATGS